MPKLSKSVPKYRKHRASGQAVVTLSGRDHYLGPHGTRASHHEYDRLVAEWLANGRVVDRRPGEEDLRDVITVGEVLAQYWTYAQDYYGDTAKRRGTANNLKPLLRLIRIMYGPDQAAKFGPLKLQAIRQRLIDSDQSRGYVNANVGRVKRLFRWAVARELVRPEVSSALDSVEGLRAGRSKAREGRTVKPVDIAYVEAVLPHLPETVADLLRLQLLTGARPGELCIMRPADIDRSGAVWVYRPSSHKTATRGKDRAVFVGPRGQDILRRYLLRPETSFCFSPRESERKRRALQHAARVTPMSCGNKPRRGAKIIGGTHYTNDSLRRALHRACIRAKVPKWSPHQLRHTKATEIGAAFGLEGVRTVLGHSDPRVSAIYAERDGKLAAEIMSQIG